VTGDLEVTDAEGNHVPHTYCFVWKETHPENGAVRRYRQLNSNGRK
jgi:hypothetical protein